MKIIDYNFNEVDIRIKSFTPNTKFSYSLEKLSSLRYSVIDRGYSSDVYECEIVTVGSLDYINSILTILETQRKGSITSNPLVLTDFADNKGESLFGTNVDYSGSIDVIVIDTPKRSQKSFNVYTLTFNIRALGLSFEGTPIFPSMTCIWSGWSGREDEWNRVVNDSYYNDNYISTVVNDNRVFQGKFTCSINESINLLELFRTTRGNPIGVSSSNIGVATPFGLTTSINYQVVITDLSYEFSGSEVIIVRMELTEIGGIV